MASGHVNRANKPNTWLQPTSCTAKKTLANREPSHTWHLVDILKTVTTGPLLNAKWGILASARGRCFEDSACQRWRPGPKGPNDLDRPRENRNSPARK